jgi:Cu/Ag efflux pump CusA
VDNVGAHVGRAVTSDQIVNVNSAELWVNVHPSADYDATVTAIEGVVEGYPEVSSDVLTYSEQRIMDLLPRTDDELAVRIYGENPGTLRSKAEEVRALLEGIEGVAGSHVALPEEEPTLEVQVDLARAQAVGVNPGDVRRAAATLFGGIVVGNLFEEQRIFDVVVWGAPEIRKSESDVRSLLIEAPRVGYVQLGEVADVRMVRNPSVIRHESVATYLDVRAEAAGRSVGEVAGDVERGLAGIEFPLEYHAELRGGYAEQRAAQWRVFAVAVAAAIVVFLLFQAAFTSWRLAALCFVTLPMALVGGVLAALVDGGTITLGSVAGFVAVLGIAARHGIVLIRHYQRLERHEGRPFGLELVDRGTRDRLGPMFLTLLATTLVFAPILIAGDAAGSEIVRPMAVVVLGGLVTSTVLNLVVMPAAYLRYGFVAEPDLSSEDLLSTLPDVDAVRG